MISESDAGNSGIAGRHDEPAFLEIDEVARSRHSFFPPTLEEKIPEFFDAFFRHFAGRSGLNKMVGEPRRGRERRIEGARS